MVSLCNAISARHRIITRNREMKEYICPWMKNPIPPDIINPNQTRPYVNCRAIEKAGDILINRVKQSTQRRIPASNVHNRQSSSWQTNNLVRKYTLKFPSKLMWNHQTSNHHHLVVSLRNPSIYIIAALSVALRHVHRRTGSAHERGSSVQAEAVMRLFIFVPV